MPELKADVQINSSDAGYADKVGFRCKYTDAGFGRAFSARMFVVPDCVLAYHTAVN